MSLDFQKVRDGRWRRGLESVYISQVVALLFFLFFFPLFCDLIENNCLNVYALLHLSRGSCNDDSSIYVPDTDLRVLE